MPSGGRRKLEGGMSSMSSTGSGCATSAGSGIGGGSGVDGAGFLGLRLGWVMISSIARVLRSSPTNSLPHILEVAEFRNQAIT